MGESNKRDIVAATGHYAGLRILGRDNVNETMIGTRFAHIDFGEQEAAYAANQDTVSFERRPSDFGTEAGLQIRLVCENLSSIPLTTEPWGVYGVNANVIERDRLYGIDKIFLTRFNDALSLTAQTFDRSGGNTGRLVVDLLQGINRLDVTSVDAPLTINLFNIADQRVSLSSEANSSVAEAMIGLRNVSELRGAKSRDRVTLPELTDTATDPLILDLDGDDEDSSRKPLLRGGRCRLALWQVSRRCGRPSSHARWRPVARIA